MDDYTISCECGASHCVSAGQAGCSITCSCERTLDVPSLSTLRESAGLTAIPLSTIQKIELMISKSELPSGSVCPLSGRPADVTVFFHVQCEQSWVTADDSKDNGRTFAGMLFFGWIGAFFASRTSRSYEVLGRDTEVTIPLRVSSEVRPKLMAMRNQRKLKKLLSKTYIYERLLREYTGAKISPIRWDSDIPQKK